MPDLDPQLQPFIYGLMFIMGLCFGSFLNVMAYRFLTDQSVVEPPSHCPQCKTPLKWYENLPVIAYILQKGQCKTCGTPIGLEYPLAELGTGLLFVGVVWYSGLTLQTVFLLYLICNLVVITITDFKESLIFQINSLSLVPVGLVYSFLDLGQTSQSSFQMVAIAIPDSFISAVIGVFVAFVVFEGLILLSEMVFGTEGFGHGDTHLMMGVGAFLGWELMLVALLLGFVFQAVPAIPMLGYQYYKSKAYVSLISGAASFLFAGLSFWVSYMDMDAGLRTVLILVLMVFSIVAVVILMRQVKRSQSFTYLPLGPALVLGSLTMLFWGRQIMDYYMKTVMHQWG